MLKHTLTHDKSLYVAIHTYTHKPRMHTHPDTYFGWVRVVDVGETYRLR